MCLLMVAEGGHTPERADLERACKTNPDGFGFAVIGDGKVIVDKGMKSGPVLDKFYKVRKRFPDRSCLFHARIGTHGVKTVYNVHPFAVDDDNGIVLAHNGILPVVTMRGKDDIRSDTRIFAEDYMEGLGFGSLDNPQIFDMIEKFIGRGNKIAVLNVTDMMDKELYILNYDQGYTTDDKGIWWSNKSFEEKKAFSYKDFQYRVYPTPNDHGVYWDYPAKSYLDKDGWECSWDGKRKEESVQHLPKVNSSLISQGSGLPQLGTGEAASTSIPAEESGSGITERSVGEDCPKCEKVLDGYSILHDMCGSCYTCLDCLRKVDECSCVGMLGRSADDIWWLMEGGGYEARGSGYLSINMADVE